MLRLALTTPKKKITRASEFLCSSAPRQEETMSLDTLLEAARYLELQELKEQQQRQALAPLVRTHLQPAPLPPQTQPTAIVKTKQESLTITQLHQQPPQVQQQPQQQQQQPPPPPQQQSQQRVIQNSFDIINPLVIDEGGEHKRKQPPLVFRSGTREVHNKLEKHRRAHLKECFDFLKKQLPAQIDEKKTSNLSILHSALRYIQCLKRKERELEHEMERLAREKISAQQKLAVLKKEIAAQCDNVDFSMLLPEQLSTTPLPNSIEPRVQETPPPIERVSISQMPKQQLIPNGIKENNVTTIQHQQAVQQQPVQQQQQPPPQQMQTTALSVVPMAGYPVSQGLLVHKLALVPKGIAELSPLTAVSSPVAHFITAPAQQLNGKVTMNSVCFNDVKGSSGIVFEQVLPMVNAQYVVKPVVVVSSPPSVAPRPS